MAQMPRILTPTERRGVAYQSQGSHPDAALGYKAHSLYSTLRFANAAGLNTFNLFGQSVDQAGGLQWTNVNQPNTVPGGQNMSVFGISFDVDFADTLDADIPVVLNDFSVWMRRTLVRFGRTNSDWDAEFPLAKLLPPVLVATAAAGNRVGDFSRNSGVFSFAAPVVLGQNTSFFFKLESAISLAALDPLVANSVNLRFYLDGALTKKVSA
jgi:hypothetical protein